MATLIQLLEEELSRRDSTVSNITQRIFLKEVLQSYVLSFIYNHKNYRHLNLYGGTCLRIIYGINRMSEDIDLDNSKAIDITALPKDLDNYFRNRMGTDLTIAAQNMSNSLISRITLKFPVLYELQLSQPPSENLHLKIEISHHDQHAKIHATPIIHHGISYIPHHFSIESLMAGKILACLERSFRIGKTDTDFKARDFYDLLWMMQMGIEPYEEKLLTDGTEPYTSQHAISLINERVKRIRVEKLLRDLSPLFENKVFITDWCESFHENFGRFSQPYLLGSSD